MKAPGAFNLEKALVKSLRAFIFSSTAHRDILVCQDMLAERDAKIRELEDTIRALKEKLSVCEAAEVPQINRKDTQYIGDLEMNPEVSTALNGDDNTIIEYSNTEPHQHEDSNENENMADYNPTIPTEANNEQDNY